jgi:enoyl-CoA hydratase/carnithine racemase
MKRIPLAGYQARHFGWSVDGPVATITLDRPERKNPLTFDSYGELRDLFRGAGLL